MTSVGKFDRIVVAIGNVGLHLVELGGAEADGFGPDPAAVVFDVSGEGEFGPGQHADCDGGVLFRSEAAGRGAAECRTDQCLADLGGTSCQSVQTIVTHRMLLVRDSDPNLPEAEASI